MEVSRSERVARAARSQVLARAAIGGRTQAPWRHAVRRVSLLTLAPLRDGRGRPVKSKLFATDPANGAIPPTIVPERVGAASPAGWARARPDIGSAPEHSRTVRQVTTPTLARRLRALVIGAKQASPLRANGGKPAPRPTRSSIRTVISVDGLAVATGTAPSIPTRAVGLMDVVGAGLSPAPVPAASARLGRPAAIVPLWRASHVAVSTMKLLPAGTQAAAFATAVAATPSRTDRPARVATRREAFGTAARDPSSLLLPTTAGHPQVGTIPPVAVGGRESRAASLPSASDASVPGRGTPAGPGPRAGAWATAGSVAGPNRPAAANRSGEDPSTSPVQLSGTLVVDGRAIGRIASAQQARTLAAAPASGRALDLRAMPLTLGRPVPPP